MVDDIQEVKVRIYNKTLDPKVWDESLNLKPEVRVILLKVAQDFYKNTELKAPVVDIFFLGSTANYNWTPSSDIDVHIIIDITKENVPPEHARQYMDGLGAGWNANHEIVVKGHPVEVYLQDQTEKNGSPALSRKGSSMYSLIQNKWLKRPDHTQIDIDRDKIKSKYREIERMVNEFVSEKNVDKLKKLMKAIRNYRNVGLTKEGEFSTENLVFKALRHTGIITKLKDAINTIYDKSVSLSELIQKKRNYLVVGLTNSQLQVMSKIDYVGAIPGDSLSAKVKHGDFSSIGYNEEARFQMVWRYKSKNNTLYWYTGTISDYQEVNKEVGLWEEMKNVTIEHLGEKFSVIHPQQRFGTDRYDSEAHYVNEMLSPTDDKIVLGNIESDLEINGVKSTSRPEKEIPIHSGHGLRWRWRTRPDLKTCVFWWGDPTPHQQKVVSVFLGEKWGAPENLNHLSLFKFPHKYAGILHGDVGHLSNDEMLALKNKQEFSEESLHPHMNESKFDPFTAKDLEFVTYGGLSPTKQKGYGNTTFHAPPASRGIYAFVWPYIEHFLLGGGEFIDPKIRGKGQRQRMSYVKDKDGNVVTSDHPDWEKLSGVRDSDRNKNRSFHREIPGAKENDDYDKKYKQFLYRDNSRKKFKYNGPIWHHLLDNVRPHEVWARHGTWVKTDMETFKRLFQKELKSMLIQSRKAWPDAQPTLKWVSWDHLEVFIDSKI